jgi:hypothetical protein
MTLAFAGLVAGFVHVLSGPDHLAAIAPYAVTGKTQAWRTGVRWGLGHGAGVLIVGVAALLLRHALPVEALSAWSETCVGFVLVAIGLWGLRAALAGRGAAVKAHPGRQPHVHGRVAVAVGTLHGLAGTSHLRGSCRRSRCPRTSSPGPICSFSSSAACWPWDLLGAPGIDRGPAGGERCLDSASPACGVLGDSRRRRDVLDISMKGLDP